MSSVANVPDEPAASVAVITVTYNSESEIESFVDSVRRQGVRTVLWLIDNASRDGTVQILNRYRLSDPSIRVVLNQTNVGLAAANNIPLSQLRETYTIIANPDGLMRDGMMKSLIRRLQESSVIAVAPVNEDQNGNPHSSFFRHWTLFHLFMWRMLPPAFARFIYRYVRTYGEQDVLFASGACLMMRTADFVRIGGYDSNYFLTLEDACDLCIRLRRADAQRVVIEPEARFMHLISRSAAAVPFVTLWNGARGSIYHFRKHHGLVGGVGAYLILWASAAVRVAVALPLAPFSARAKATLANSWRVLIKLATDNPLTLR